MAYYLTSKIKQETGQRMKRLRKKHGMKQVDVAVAAGIGVAYYGKIERGVVNPSLEKVYGIIRTLNAKSSEILPF